MLARFKSRHALWGRPLEQCIQKYQIGAAPRSKNSEASVAAASVAAEQIGRFSPRVDGPNTRDMAEPITISTLEAILKMAEDEHTYALFLSPGLIGGCISLMQSMKISGKLSVSMVHVYVEVIAYPAQTLSYEYGYLCLRIILFALGTYLLHRSQNLELAKKNMIESHEIELPLVFSSHVSRTVIQLVQRQTRGQGMETRRAPGWGTVDSELALVSPDQIKALVDILWKDRVNLLRGMMSTYVPALPGLMFMFSRFLCIDPSLARQRIHGVDLLQKVLEIHYLCSFVGTREQGNALDMTMYEMTGVFESEELAMSREFTGVDISDARTIYEAYIKRLSLSDGRLYSSIDVTSASLFLELLVANIDQDIEALLPDVLGSTIEMLWKAVIAEELDLLISCFLTVCLHI
ncbi:hypothetical protein FRC11_008928, partial [Ceratobasidium sp. 423]